MFALPARRSSIVRPAEPASIRSTNWTTEQLAKRLVVVHAAAATRSMPADRARAVTSRSLTTTDVVHRVMSHNPDTFWAIARRSEYDAQRRSAEGFFAFLMLNEAGMRAADRWNARYQQIPICRCSRRKMKSRPGSISGPCHARGRRSPAEFRSSFEKISTPLYRDVDVYARAVTVGWPCGFLEAIGFQRGATYRRASRSASAYVSPRQADDAEDGPTLRRLSRSRGKADELSVTIARTLEDSCVSRRFAAPSTCAEQKCPYDEEFDGNDFSATHLIGYVGNEPAGCLRIRYFADFAKIERLAVRQEFRKTRLAFQIVRAGIEFCRAKGYRRIYGHSQKRC